ncbi:probable TPR domain protein [Ramularia collo-cygni]|uniref:Probable TPR domain protein n=1 Tax=Ramularia collo-cygni TaxID=112498 RepID=A0A2D3UTX7_9PEZI|nr:probable TPR domain protein [Ramularia collo-cygni]CZT18518.1 probable TPR domain protein [Ramularia collo-cygni]
MLMPSQPPSIEEPYFNLGLYSRPITTTSLEAQIWFDRGLLWTYAFNHEEAIRCFEYALEFDPQCIMALWGLAYALGPNYNKPWEAFGEGERINHLQRASLAVTEAEALIDPMEDTETEQELIKALRRRYPSNTEAEDYEKWNQDYANYMSTLHITASRDLDIVALYADSLMNLTPWSLWDIHTNLPTEGAHTLEVKEILESALALKFGNDHPGLLHLYIHLMEMSPSPDSALPIANRLRGLVPDAGHLEHMPTHLDVLCGDWESAITSNTSAIAADEKYLKVAGPLNFYSLYRAHNLHFKIYAAMFAGQYKIALETAEAIEQALPLELLQVENPPMADWLESFVGLKVHVFVRFGKWEHLLRIPLPENQEIYCVTTALLHYGRGIAFSVLGKLAEAKDSKKSFEESRAKVPDSRTLFNNTAKDILAIAASMLSGEFSYRSGEIAMGFEYLQKALTQSDKLPYDEPWGWMQPPRHAYGALLLEQGKVEEAKEVYAADLGLSDVLPRALRHPKNVWALHGYCECLRRLGRRDQGLEAELEGMMGRTDVLVRASCFCRREGGG